MSVIGTYRLPSSGTVELRDDYLAWSPIGFKSWADWHDNSVRESWFEEKGAAWKIVISNQQGTNVTLWIESSIGRDALPMSFLLEDVAKIWYTFLLVATSVAPDKQFLIPIPPSGEGIGQRIGKVGSLLLTFSHMRKCLIIGIHTYLTYM